MGDVKLTQRELAALDRLIDSLEGQVSSKGKRVALGSVLMPTTTAVWRAINIVTGGPQKRGRRGANVSLQDARALGQIHKLTAGLKTRVSLADLLELRRSAKSRKR